MVQNKNNKAIWNMRIKKGTSSIFKKVGSSIDVDKDYLKKIYKDQLPMSKCYLSKKLYHLKLKTK